MAVIKTESSFPSTSKEPIQIHYAVWKDDSIQKPVGVVQLTHGGAEHIDRYDEMAEMFAKAGYVVCGQDHIGHGKTAGVKATLVFPKDVKKAMMEDMHKLYKLMHKQYPDLPYFLYGHSMGSMLGRLYLRKYSKELTGCILCGTGPMPVLAYYIAPFGDLIANLLGPSFKKAVAKEEAKHPDLTAEISTKAPTKAEMLMNSWLSYDKDNIVAYVQNPYECAKINFSLLYLFGMMMRATPLRWAKKVDKNLPIFVISGTDDLAGLFTLGPKQVNRLLSKAHRNVTMKLYPHAKHEIHNEADSGTKKEVFADLLEFVECHNPNTKDERA